VTAGPFESEHEARSAAHSVIPPSEGMTILSSAQNRQLIGEALEEAGVRTGAYDLTVADFLAGLGDGIWGAVAGWVRGAHAAGIAVRVKDGSEERSGDG
jgi:hypothetical protein